LRTSKEYNMLKGHINQNLGLYLAIFFLPFTYWRFPFNIKISEGISLILMFSFLLRHMINPQQRIYLTPFFMPILIIITSAAISLWQIHLIPSEIYNESWAHGRYNPNLSGVLSILRYIFLLGFLILVVNKINSSKMLERILKTYLIAGGVVSLIGVCQLIGALTGIKFFESFVDIFSTRWGEAPLYQQYIGDIKYPRISGPNNEPKMFANTLVAVIPFTIMALVQNWTILKRNVLFCLLTVQILALFLTFSASGWVAIVIAILYLFVHLSKTYNLKFMLKFMLKVFFFLCVILLSILFFFLDINQLIAGVSYNLFRIFNYFSEVNVGQTGPMLAGLEMFKEHPFLGVGIGHFPFHFNNYNILNLPPVDYPILASNEYVSILAETGLIGAFSWFLFIFVFLKFIKKFKSNRLINQNNFFYSVFIASIAATIGCWLQLWATYGIFNPHIWFPLALAITARRLYHREKKYA